MSLKNNLSTVFIIVIMLLTFFGFVLYIYFTKIRVTDSDKEPTKTVDIDKLVDNQDFANIWVIDPADVECSIYYNPIKVVNNVSVFQKPPSSLFSLDGMIPSTLTACILENGMSYGLVNRTCKGKTTNTYNFCINEDGSKANLGDTDTIYTNKVCDIPPSCSGYLGIIVGTNNNASIDSYCASTTIGGANTKCVSNLMSLPNGYAFYVTEFSVTVNKYIKKAYYLQRVSDGLYLNGNNREGFTTSSCDSSKCPDQQNSVKGFEYGSISTCYQLETFSIIDQDVEQQVEDFINNITQKAIDLGFVPGTSTKEDVFSYINSLGFFNKRSFFRQIQESEAEYNDIISQGLLTIMPQTLIFPPTDFNGFDDFPESGTDIFNWLQANSFVGVYLSSPFPLFFFCLINNSNQCCLNGFNTKIKSYSEFNDFIDFTV